MLAGQECSEKADIWSLGVVLWEIVTGERPHLRQLRPVRVPEECPAEVADAINACRQLGSGARPTALEICNLIEASAPRCSLSSDAGSMPPGTCRPSVAGVCMPWFRPGLWELGTGT